MIKGTEPVAELDAVEFHAFVILCCNIQGGPLVGVPT